MIIIRKYYYIFGLLCLLTLIGQIDFYLQKRILPLVNYAAILFDFILCVSSHLAIIWFLYYITQIKFSFRFKLPTIHKTLWFWSSFLFTLAAFDNGGFPASLCYGLFESLLGSEVILIISVLSLIASLFSIFNLKKFIVRKPRKKSVKTTNECSTSQVESDVPSIEMTGNEKHILTKNKKTILKDVTPVLKIKNVSYSFPQVISELSEKNENEHDFSDEIVTAFNNFSVDISIVESLVSPSVVVYFMLLDADTKLSHIKAVIDDVAIRLGFAEGALRLNTGVVGRKHQLALEVPRVNRNKLTLNLSKEDLSRPLILPICLGVSTLNESKFSDLCECPHLLISGATGSGKSVFINTLLISLLSKLSPSDLQLVLIDPKAVELNFYENIPHLLYPICTEVSDSQKILKELCSIMDLRFEIFRELKVRNIQEYRDKQSSNTESMPYIVIVIDELADLMMTSGKVIESYIVRLAQKARACGIHLVLATQRPTVDVVTGLIKANVPARLAFKVASRVDSEVILGAAGAERLLGKGDCLFSSPDTNVDIRLQSPFIRSHDLSDFLKNIKYSE